MTPKQLARIEARGQRIEARLWAIHDGILADGRDEATDEEFRQLNVLQAELRSLTAKLGALSRRHALNG